MQEKLSILGYLKGFRELNGLGAVLPISHSKRVSTQILCMRLGYFIREPRAT